MRHLPLQEVVFRKMKTILTYLSEREYTEMVTVYVQIFLRKNRKDMTSYREYSVVVSVVSYRDFHWK